MGTDSWMKQTDMTNQSLHRKLAKDCVLIFTSEKTQNLGHSITKDYVEMKKLLLMYMNFCDVISLFFLLSNTSQIQICDCV